MLSRLTLNIRTKMRTWNATYGTPQAAENAIKTT